MPSLAKAFRVASGMLKPAINKLSVARYTLRSKKVPLGVYTPGSRIIKNKVAVKRALGLTGLSSTRFVRKYQKYINKKHLKNYIKLKRKIYNKWSNWASRR